MYTFCHWSPRKISSITRSSRSLMQTLIAKWNRFIFQETCSIIMSCFIAQAQPINLSICLGLIWVQRTIKWYPCSIIYDFRSPVEDIISSILLTSHSRSQVHHSRKYFKILTFQCHIWIYHKTLLRNEYKHWYNYSWESTFNIQLNTRFWHNYGIYCPPSAQRFISMLFPGKAR